MKHFIYIANYAIQGEPSNFVQLAVEAEKAGWYGFFIWDHIYPDIKDTKKVTDPWITLAAIAASTELIRLGTTVTPLPRRRPQKVAREVASLDRLSEGRFTLGVGLGPPEEFALFGEETDTKIRAEKLDECLEILRGLWSGKEFTYHGKHYFINNVTFEPRPKQKTIPIWCAGTWPLKAPFRRAARYEGVFPLGLNAYLEPDDFIEIRRYIDQYRTKKSDYDVIDVIRTKGPNDTEWVPLLSEAGVTGLAEVVMEQDMKKILERVRKGPVNL
jgi:alkanesulfonate monooxygenase SsuD/methylene tetrahydromethanopterin reductase-like flavin-dependent oxidoreductase (luciferase family)